MRAGAGEAPVLAVAPCVCSADSRFALYTTETTAEEREGQVGNGSASCLAAFCLAGRPPGCRGDHGVGLVQRLRCRGARIAALSGQRQTMDERSGQRQGDSQQQPHPQAPGEKCPHAQGPFRRPPSEVPQRYPPCPGLTTSQAAWYPADRVTGPQAAAQPGSLPRSGPAR
jgi:hypothetical protein